MNTEAQPPVELPELQTFRAEVVSSRDLPTIPAVLARILTVCEGENTSAKDLVEVIEHDQVLTSRILKLANSALFGLPRKVATVPRAVVLVGFNTVRNLALGVKVWDALAGGKRQRDRVQVLWQHSALVAATAKVLARRIRSSDPDVTFTAGLLHDMGKLVISLKLGMRYWSLVEAAEADNAARIEGEHLGVDHSEVGGWLAEAWRLPPSLVGAIRDHHNEDLLLRAEWSAADVVSAADRLVHGTDFVTGEHTADADAVLELTSTRGLSPEDWQALIRQLKAEADTLCGVFAGS